jgi:hypothetical protein
MSNWKAHLPKPKPVTKTIQAVMVRPSIEACEWLVSQATIHGVSVNAVVLALIESARLENMSIPREP